MLILRYSRSFIICLILICEFSFVGLALASNKPTLSILAIGQSNMEGRYGPASDLFPHEDDSVQAWDLESSSWKTAKLGTSPFNMAKGMRGAANNLAYVFAQKLATRCAVNVNLVLLAAGGKRIEYFLPNWMLKRQNWVNAQQSEKFGASISDEIMSYSGIGFRALKPGDFYDVLLIHQGEANALTSTEEALDYAKKLTLLIRELRYRKLIHKDTPVVMGGINQGYGHASFHMEALRLTQSMVVGIVDWTDIETVGLIDGTNNQHATGRGLDQLGIRYFNRYKLLSGFRFCKNR